MCLLPSRELLAELTLASDHSTRIGKDVPPWDNGVYSENPWEDAMMPENNQAGFTDAGRDGVVQPGDWCLFLVLLEAVGASRRAKGTARFPILVGKHKPWGDKKYSERNLGPLISALVSLSGKQNQPPSMRIPSLVPGTRGLCWSWAYDDGNSARY